MPKLIKLYIRSVALGFGIAAAFVAMLLYFNVMNLAPLIFESDVGYVALFILWFMNGIVFAGVQFAWAIMAMAEPRDNGRGGTPVVQEFSPVRVASGGPEARKPSLRR